MNTAAAAAGTTIGSTRFATAQKPSAAPYSRIFTHPTPHTTSPNPDIELNEDDIFSAQYDAVPNTNPSSPSSPSPSFRSDKSGILAALSEPDRPVFNHKAEVNLTAGPPRVSASVSNVNSPHSSSSASSAASSAKMMIPLPPKRQQSLEKTSFLIHQSAPVNIPVLPEQMRKRQQSWKLVDAVDESDDEDGDESVMVPPHVILARRESPLLSSSVLEGAGRTLKGRDLRQVRNAVWRRTGFLD